MYIKRNFYQKLMDWKKESRHGTLEIQGTRQVGKTFIINKFADENYRHKLYINFFEPSGQQFLECYYKAIAWTPGTPRPEHPLQDAFRLFDQSFEDTDDTVIIIDEIQESAEIYNRIREFTRQFQCQFIIIDSYPGRVLASEFRFSCGDVTSITLYPLSFEEFLAAANQELFQQYLMVGSSISEDHIFYQRLRSSYDIYCQIGGYPSVVEKYLMTGSVRTCLDELARIADIFLIESMQYTDISDIGIFREIFLNICHLLAMEKKSSRQDSIGNLLHNLVTKDGTRNLSEATMMRAFNWLYLSKVIGFCGEIIELDILDFRPGRRAYFMDLGIANFYMNQAGIDEASIKDMLNENYVYINLAKRLDFPGEIAFETPAFASYKDGEIDFYVQSLQERIRYAIRTNNDILAVDTSKAALKAGKVDYLLYLTDDTHGSVDGKRIIMPIYSLERFHF